MRGEIKAEQRGRRVRSVDEVPDEQCHSSQLAIDDRKAGIDGPERLVRPGQELTFPEVRHVVGGAIAENEVPSRVEAGHGEEGEGDFGRGEERRRHDDGMN